MARGQRLSDQLSDNRREHRRTSAYTRVPDGAGERRVFAGNFAHEDAWGSRGRGFKSRRPDWSEVFDLLLDGQWEPAWEPMVSRVGLGRCGGLRLEDAVHGRGALGEGGPDLVPVDGLGDRRAAAPNQVADVLKPIRGLLQWSEACLSLGNMGPDRLDEPIGLVYGFVHETPWDGALMRQTLDTSASFNTSRRRSTG
jgi:hypothetical protein